MRPKLKDSRQTCQVRSVTLCCSLLVSAFLIGTVLKGQYVLVSPSTGSILASCVDTGNSTVPGANKFATVTDLEKITKRILGPDSYGQGCPKDCGCPESNNDCPRHYAIQDIRESANFLLDTKSTVKMDTLIEKHHLEAERGCADGLTSDIRGGWCLGHRNKHPDGLAPLVLPDGRSTDIPEAHQPASRRIAETLEELFVAEKVSSVSDFGAGVGQYGFYFKEKLPNLIYRGYDGAGDIEAYTSGFVRYADFTLPLDLPVSDWVVSLEVGEHIPSKFEGMFIRNLHRHNCRGVILSWAVLDQVGENHINCHSNEYVANVFLQLGYVRDFQTEAKLRRREGNHLWFIGSALVFRRENPVC